jgi:hypothetical protein
MQSLTLISPFINIHAYSFHLLTYSLKTEAEYTTETSANPPTSTLCKDPRADSILAFIINFNYKYTVIYEAVVFLHNTI